MYQLYYYPGNANLAPHILLEEIGADYRLTLVDRANNQQKSPEYLKLNPHGRIPVLVDGDLALYEAAAICLHLADRHPQAQLAPAVGSMLDIIEATLAASGGPYLLGPEYCAVDPYLLMLCRWTRGMQNPARNRPQLARFLETVMARPAAQRAFAAEGIEAPYY